MNYPIYHLPEDTRRQLATLKLESDFLRESLLIGESFRATCTPNDPITAPGYRAYQGIVRGLRDILVPSGWKAFRRQTWELILDPSETIAIAVCPGDSNVGNRQGFPQVKRSRGSLIADAVESNAEQLVLFELPHLTKKREERNIKSFITWFLLHYRTANEIRFELALPETLTEDGYVKTWAERIIMDPIALGQAREISPFDQEPPITITIERRNDEE